METNTKQCGYKPGYCGVVVLTSRRFPGDALQVVTLHPVKQETAEPQDC